MSRRWQAIPWSLVAALVLGGALRFATLGHQSYWNDESATLAILHHPLSGLLSAVRATESTPPLYYLLAWPWAHVFGFGEAGVRSLSALMGTATILVGALVARRLGGRRAGDAAAWLAATSPVLVWYSQEARAYSLLALLSGLSVGAFLAARAQPTRTRLGLWSAVNVAGSRHPLLRHLPSWRRALRAARGTW